MLTSDAQSTSNMCPIRAVRILSIKQIVPDYIATGSAQGKDRPVERTKPTALLHRIRCVLNAI